MNKYLEYTVDGFLLTIIALHYVAGAYLVVCGWPFCLLGKWAAGRNTNDEAN